MSKLIEQEYILLILNCEKYKYKADIQKKTWLKQLPSYLTYYHVIGNSNLTTLYEFVEESHILYVNTKDDYLSLPHKSITAFNAVNDTFNYKYILKTDDDQRLNNINFFDMVKQSIEQTEYKTNYGGRIINIDKEHISQYYLIHPELPNNCVIKAIQYCSGRFYYLSKTAVIDLLSKKEDICKEYFEDYAIGLYLDNNLKQTVINVKADMFLSDMLI